MRNLKILINIIFIISILINIGLIFVIMPLQNNLKIQQGEKLNKVYTTIYNRYEIGKNFNGLTICDKFIKNGCLDGLLKSYKKVEILKGQYGYYIYFNLNKNIFPSGNGYYYKFFGNYDFKSITDKNNIPSYGIINPFYVELYSEKDLLKVNEIDKKIFLELKNNP